MLTVSGSLIIALALLGLVIVLRFMLRLSAQWTLLKKNWSWKDEVQDTLIYWLVLTGLVLGLFKFTDWFAAVL